MSQKWDPVDKMIMDSRRDIHESSDYNESLLKKIQGGGYSKENSLVAGFSLILAGVLALFIYTSDIQYKLVNIQIKARSEIMTLYHHYSSFELNRLFIGE